MSFESYRRTYRKMRRRSSGENPLVLWAALFVIFWMLIGGPLSLEILPKRVVEGTITGYQIESGDTHFIFEHEDGTIEVLENNDAMVWYGKINSSDFMPVLQEGGQFRLTLVGKRIPLLSKYRNILGYERLGDVGE